MPFIRKKLLIAFALLIPAIAIAMVWALAHRGSDDARPGPPVTDVYSKMAAALSRAGMVAHVMFDDGDSNAFTRSQREAWLDVPHDVAREQTTTTYRSPSVSATRQRGVMYARGAALAVGEDARQTKVPFEACPYASPRTLTLFGGCPGSRSETETHTESSRHFQGIDALAIVTTGEVSGIDSIVEVHNTLFVDASTFLPIAYQSNGTDRYALGGHEQNFDRTTRYAIDFVARDSLPSGYFDPASIGYSEPVPEQTLGELRTTFPVFWLGRIYSGDRTTPVVALSDVRTIGSGQPEFGDTIVLTYARDDDRFAELLTISQMSAAHARFLAMTGGIPEWQRDPCSVWSEVAVPRAHAILYRWHIGNASVDSAHCSADRADGLALELDFGDTFVTVLPSVYLTLNDLSNPYASEAALRALSTVIQPRP